MPVTEFGLEGPRDQLPAHVKPKFNHGTRKLATISAHMRHWRHRIATDGGIDQLFECWKQRADSTTISICARHRLRTNTAIWGFAGGRVPQFCAAPADPATRYPSDLTQPFYSTPSSLDGFRGNKQAKGTLVKGWRKTNELLCNPYSIDHRIIPCQKI
jgi:hypothetical protein